MRLATAIALACIPMTVSASPLQGTPFEQAAQKHDLDPRILYAVALAESARATGEGTISPWPWTLRIPEEGIYAESREAAETKLESLIDQYESIDIGIMQISMMWHGHRVENPSDLLDPKTAIHIGAEILREAIDSAPGDLELGIGRYHHWADESLSRNYGSRVLAFYQNLKKQNGWDSLHGGGRE